MEKRLPSPHLPLSPPVSRHRHYLPRLYFSLSLKNPQKTSNQVWNSFACQGALLLFRRGVCMKEKMAVRWPI
ncbi:unnamed protein product [Linum tenue]|uniref:Uncharacterized protein n=1 Tax=Linum tenue TaxID=586396 RepID=A0AAV0RVL2_9ROSI|nr:unnamed protein product [Linum tenue]